LTHNFTGFFNTEEPLIEQGIRRLANPEGFIEFYTAHGRICLCTNMIWLSFSLHIPIVVKTISDIKGIA